MPPLNKVLKLLLRANRCGVHESVVTVESNKPPKYIKMAYSLLGL